MSSLPKGVRNNIFQIKKSPMTLNSKFKKRLKRINSVNGLREKNWNDRFIYDKIPNYDSFKDKNVLINLRAKCNSSRRKLGNALRGNPLSFIDNSLYLFRPLSNKTSFVHPLINTKYGIKTISAKTRDINYKNNNNRNIDSHRNYLLYGFNNKRLENKKKEEILSKTNNIENNFNNINLINLNKIIKLWDELSVIKNYRKLFCVIYKELDDEDKEELYQRETNELISIKNDINTLKNYIELRLNTIKEIFELNKKLNTEIINKDIKSNENIINEISDKIGILRSHTVKVCQSMKKLKLVLNGVKNLDKYDIDIIAEKFKFDKNYLIKMKGELNFLKEGFAKYYFNVKYDQTPFLLKTSEKNKINEKEPFIHLVPLDKELKNEIMECSYYIYQELIAYQNEKVNNKILRCISPLKRVILKNNQDEEKIINGKEENNINLKNNDNNNINNINNINSINIKKSSSLVDSSRDKNNQNEKNEFINSKDIKENIDKISNDINNNINNKKEIINLKRNDKKYKTGPMGMVSQKDKKSDIKNILLNYKINERNANKRKSDVNRKKNNILINNDEKNRFSENNKNNDEYIKDSDANVDKFLEDKNKNEIKKNSLENE